MRETEQHKSFLQRMHHFQSRPEQRTLVSWQNANSNLNFNKNLQWNLTYYLLLLFGAIIALALRIRSSPPVLRLLLFLAANVVFDVGFWLTWSLQHQIRRERLSIINSTMRLVETDRERREIRERKRNATKLFSYPIITITVFGTLLAGYISALIVIVYVN